MRRRKTLSYNVTTFVRLGRINVWVCIKVFRILCRNKHQRSGPESNSFLVSILTTQLLPAQHIQAVGLLWIRTNYVWSLTQMGTKEREGKLGGKEHFKGSFKIVTLSNDALLSQRWVNHYLQSVFILNPRHLSTQAFLSRCVITPKTGSQIGKQSKTKSHSSAECSQVQMQIIASTCWYSHFPEKDNTIFFVKLFIFEWPCL